MDRIWGRGASDDKGPTYAALFGAIAVRDVCAAAGVRLSRRVRVIFGCDEESGWECMAHYFGAAAQPKPTVAFTPDAYFPLVYAEKGSFTAVASKRVAASDAAELRVQSLQAGLRPNMVPGDAVATLVGEPAILDEVAHVMIETPGVCVARVAGSLPVSAVGRAAHGSTPEQGTNAAIKLLDALMQPMSVLDALDAEDREWIVDLIRRGAPDGSGLGIAGRDDVTGALTSNLGVVSYTDGLLEATFNVRYPATWDGDATIERFRKSLGETGWTVPDVRPTPPLHVPQDQEPVRTLLRVYRERTGDMETAPLTIGGRTYATTVAPVGVAYGAAMPGDPEVAHQADEYFLVERLIQCVGIYAQAIFELAR
jgi:succinyl-diaminopimelate desuccinylase